MVSLFFIFSLKKILAEGGRPPPPDIGDMPSTKSSFFYAIPYQNTADYTGDNVSLRRLHGVQRTTLI